MTEWHGASQVSLVVKNLPVNEGDLREAGSIPGLGRSPGGGHGNPLTLGLLPGESHRQRSLAGSQRVGHDWSDLAWHGTEYICESQSPIYPSPPYPLVTKSVFSTFVTLFLFHWFICTLKKNSTYKWYHMICLSPSDSLYSLWNSLGSSMLLLMALFHSVIWLSNIPLDICTTCSLVISLLIDIPVASMSWLL